MTRSIYIMKLFPGMSQEYKKRHDTIWPELEKAIAEAGILEIAIYLDERTDTLYAYERMADADLAATLSAKEITRKWWDYMADIMETNADHSPKCWNLQEMYFFEKR